jgi:Ni/Fe-hydrogenase subunit HybB-like protein
MKTIIKTIRENIFTPWGLWLAFLAVILFGALLGGLTVFWKGLSITNLTDRVPWGLWITIDLSAIAVSAGAFSLCAGVYLFGLKRYAPIARTATFVGLIGYTMAMLALLMDIGRPDRFWKALVYWNTHSLLWEVTMCIMLYLTVLVLETMLSGRAQIDPLFHDLQFIGCKGLEVSTGLDLYQNTFFRIAGHDHSAIIAAFHACLIGG